MLNIPSFGGYIHIEDVSLPRPDIPQLVLLVERFHEQRNADMYVKHDTYLVPGRAVPSFILFPPRMIFSYCLLIYLRSWLLTPSQPRRLSPVDTVYSAEIV